MVRDPLPRRVLRAERYVALEDALASEVRRARAADPLRPIDLVVGSNLLGLHLRRALARQLGALAGVRTATFLDLARAGTEGALAAEGLRPLPELGDELLIGRVVGSLPAGGYFEPVRETPGFRAALLASIRDLKDAGWSPADLRGRLTVARPPADARRKLDAFAGIFEAYERALRAGRLYDRSDLLARAAAAPEREEDSPGAGERSGLLLVYGFYDLIELQWRLLETHAHGRETVVFVLEGDGPSFAFAAPLLRRLEGAGFVRESDEPPRPGAAATRAALRAGGSPAPVQIGLPFDTAADEDGSSGARQGPDVAFLSAPGEEREAEEIVAQLLHWAERGIRFHEMAVLARRREPHLTTLGRALARAGIPFLAATGAPIGETPAAAALGALLAIVQGDWRRGDVIAFLSLADLLAELRALPDGTEAASSEWDQLSAEGGVVGGREDWTRAFTREIGRAQARAARLEAEISGKRPATDDETGETREAKLADARRALALWRRLEGTMGRIERALAPWERAATWSDAAEALREAVRALLAPSAGREAIELLLEELGALDVAGAYASREEHARLVRRALATRRLRRGRYQRDGVLLSDIVTARGLSFRAVAIAGMVERSFPAPAREDPILLDDERALLGTGGLAPLPFKGDRQSEERLLFRIASDAALERLLYARSRAMGVEERESLASPFYREALTAASRASVPHEQRVELLPPVHVEAISALDAHAWALGEAWILGNASREAGDAGSASASLREVYPFLDLALASERSRWRERVFGPYDGILDPDAAAEAAARLLTSPLSASRIERYAECPLRSLFGTVMGLQPVRDPADVRSIDPRDRGLLYHAILAELFAALAAESGGPVRLSELDRDALHRRLFETADRHFEALASDSPVGYPLLWEVEKERMRENLRQCLEETAEECAASGHLPAAFEWTFGRDEGSASAVAMDLGTAGEVSFRGRIDRIDVHHDGRRARVVDYKTRDGTYVGGDKRLADGRSIQLSIYKEAAKTYEPEPGRRLAIDTGGYVFVSGDAARWVGREGEEERRAALSHALRVLITAIRAGDFSADPRPGGACGICEFQEACGESRQRLFARKRGDAAVAGRLGLRDRA